MWKEVMNQKETVRKQRSADYEQIRIRRQYDSAVKGGSSQSSQCPAVNGKKNLIGLDGEPGTAGLPGGGASAGGGGAEGGYGQAAPVAQTCGKCPAGPPGLPGYKGKRGPR
uniref:Uncharacterized protein n=1 Tax=Meloidogyne javanica TaxID=6303 RepID=A0A915M131_MELJA